MTASAKLMGVAAAAGVCLGWTVGLALLTAAPNATVNWLMDTQTFDSGTFWRLIDPPPETLSLGIGGLGCVALGYLYIIARVTVFRGSAFTGWASRHLSFSSSLRSSRQGMARIAVAASNRVNRVDEATAAPESPPASKIAPWPMSNRLFRLVQVNETKRQVSDLCFKLLDFVVQFMLLADTMGKGLPSTIVQFFATVITLNMLLSAYAIAYPHRQTSLTTVLLDTIFDILVSVGIPIIIVLYCMKTFTFDRRRFAINMKIFPPGVFETGASINTNPVQPQIIRSALNSLRIHSGVSLIARAGSNLALCRRFYQLATLISTPNLRVRAIYPKSKVVSTFLVIFAVFTTVFVGESVRTSKIACSSHPECVENAWQWIRLRSNDLTQCPCLTVIDEEPRVKTYDEWLDPKDVTKKLAQLASSGTLQMVSLLNRKLVSLPIELQQCSKLKHISLVYTHTSTFPAWANEFTQLEYLHIEGKLGFTSLTELPDDVFGGMEMLTFLHLAGHSITKVPHLRGLRNLKYLALAVLLQLRELPDFEALHSLETLAIPILPLVDSVPDMAPLVNLNFFSTKDRGLFCCNGFIGECDLSNSLCAAHSVWGSPPVTCLSPNRTSKVATPATRAMFVRFQRSVCADQAIKPGDLETAPTREATDACGGIMFRQCSIPSGGIGMCYNMRMMAISCGSNILPREMRRRQIAEGVGDPCDPQYEAWLGCK